MNNTNNASYQEVSEFYDKEWAEIEKRKESGVNSRHRLILQKLKKAGLKRNSNVLEIGCGNGTLTNFIAGHIPNGRIVGADISPETIKMAKAKFSNRKNIEFLVSDMTNFKYDYKFDFVVFPDVLEHIPIEAHDNILKTIAGNVHQGSIVFVNIPNPRAIDYLQIHHPELMQIIDQALHTDKFLLAFYSNGFYLDNLSTYPVFYEEPDYQSLVFKVKSNFSKMTVRPKWKVLSRSIFLRLKELF